MHTYVCMLIPPSQLKRLLDRRSPPIPPPLCVLAPLVLAPLVLGPLILAPLAHCLAGLILGWSSIDVDSLATRREVDALKAEVAKLRRLGAQEREADQGAVHAELDSLKRAMHGLSLRLEERGV